MIILLYKILLLNKIKYYYYYISPFGVPAPVAGPRNSSLAGFTPLNKGVHYIIII